MCHAGRLEEQCAVHLREECARTRKTLFEARLLWGQNGGSTRPELEIAIFEYSLAMHNLEILECEDPVVTSTREVMRGRAEIEVEDMRLRTSILGGALFDEVTAKIEEYERLYVRFLGCEALATTRHIYSVADETRSLARHHSSVTYLRMEELHDDIEQTLQDRYRQLGADAVTDLWSTYTQSAAPASVPV